MQAAAAATPTDNCGKYSVAPSGRNFFTSNGSCCPFSVEEDTETGLGVARLEADSSALRSAPSSESVLGEPGVEGTAL